MDPHDLDALNLDPTATQIIGGYLGELESRLPAGRRARIQILTEIADGLACATEQHTGRGESPQAAAHAAITEFGDPRAMAAAFTRQLGPATAHRIGVGLVVTGPLVGLIWVSANATAGLDWQSQIVSVLSSMPLYPLILAITVPASMIAITGSGWAARHLAVPPRVVTGAAMVAAIGCVAGDLSLLSAAVVGHLPVPAAPVNLIAAAVSVVRLSAAGWAGRRIAQLRTAVN
jgi:hypothetical protein